MISIFCSAIDIFDPEYRDCYTIDADKYPTAAQGVYLTVQLHAHDGVEAAGWSDAWVLRWYCRP